MPPQSRDPELPVWLTLQLESLELELQELKKIISFLYERELRRDSEQRRQAAQIAQYQEDLEQLKAKLASEGQAIIYSAAMNWLEQED